MIQHHIEYALSSTEKIGVLEHDDNGDAVSMVERNTSDIAPSALEWRLAAESSVLLGKAYEATQLLQGLRTPPDQTYVVIFNLWTYCRDAHTKKFSIPSPPAPGSTAVQYVSKHWSELHPAVKKSIYLLEIQLFNRFISNGPCVPMMIMMKLNPLMKWPPDWLSEQQVAVADMHFARRYRAAKQALGLGDPSSPSSSSSSSSPRACTPVQSPGSLLSYGMRQFDSPVDEVRLKEVK